MHENVASAPGKVLLIGEYAVLERGNSAFSVAIDRRIRSSVRASQGFEVELGDFGKTARLASSGGTFSASGDDPVFKFAAASVNAVSEYAGVGGLAPFLLRTKSDSGFNLHGGQKSGIGSSAAAAVSMCAALLGHAGVRCGKKTIELVAQRAHFLAQGKVGSGFDVATSVYGTIIYRRFTPELVSGSIEGLRKSGLDSHIEYASLPKGWRLVLGFSGAAASTTGLVGKMNEYKRANAAQYSAIMNQIRIQNEVSIGALARLCADASDSQAERNLVSAMEGARLLLCGLGEKAGIVIEPEHAKGMLQRARDEGAIFSKLPGAGGGDSALAVCRDAKIALGVKRAWQGMGAYSFEACEAGEGVRFE